MKKTIYYFSPFVIIPIIFLIATLLESVEILKPTAPFFLFTALFIFSLAIGVLSPTKTTFDYAITAIIPCSVLLSLFVGLLFDEGCDGKPQLSLSHALNMEYYKVWLPIVLTIMLIMFITSFKPVRSIVKSTFSFKNLKE